MQQAWRVSLHDATTCCDGRHLSYNSKGADVTTRRNLVLSTSPSVSLQQRMLCTDKVEQLSVGRKCKA